jgi:hypothetical protein
VQGDDDHGEVGLIGRLVRGFSILHCRFKGSRVNALFDILDAALAVPIW